MQARQLRQVHSSLIQREWSDKIIHSDWGRSTIRFLTRSYLPVFIIAATAFYSVSLTVFLSIMYIVFSTVGKHYICNRQPSRYFTEKSYGESRLVIENGVPILELNEKKPYERGYAHGYLMHQEISELVKKFSSLCDIGLINIDLIAFHIPPVYLDELRGLVDGYNDRTEPNSSYPSLTIGTVILYHLLADSKQYRFVKPACTCILHYDQYQKQVVFGRNMDWLSFGSAGSLTLLIRTPKCAYWSPPGFVGVVTGLNPSGLCLAMNVFPGRRRYPTDDGMPSTFLNRYLLENCTTLSEVDQALSEIKALGAYHLTICEASDDPAKNATYSFFGDDKYTVQKGIPAEGHRLVLNRNEETGAESFDSSGRRQDIEQHGIVTMLDVISCLRLPSTNSFETVHQFIMKPASKEVFYALGNGFAGDYKLTRYDYSRLWNRS